MPGRVAQPIKSRVLTPVVPVLPWLAGAEQETATALKRIPYSGGRGRGFDGDGCRHFGRDSFGVSLALRESTLPVRRAPREFELHELPHEI